MLLRFRPRLLALVSIVCFAASANATLLAEAVVRELVGSSSNVICSDGGPGATLALTSCSGAAFNGDGRANAQYGSIATYAELAHPSPPSNNSQDFQTYGWARFTDTLEFVPSVPGDFNDGRLVFDITQGPGAFQPPPFLAGGNLFVFGTFTVRVNGLEIFPSNRPFAGAGEYWYDFDIAPGGVANISAELISDVRCFDCKGEYNGISNFWGTAVLDAVEVAGLAPSQFTVTSGAGVSYANVIPEPALAALMLASTMGILGARSHYGRSSARR